MKLGYNTNGFAYHRLEDAINIIADIGFEAVAITLDVHHLDPFQATASEVAAIDSLLRRRRLSCVIETGARFVLDSQRKHKPTLVDPEEEDRDQREQFLVRCLSIGSDLGARVISLWSGASEKPVSVRDGMARMKPHLRRLCDRASQREMKLAFEPEPGMLIETVDHGLQLMKAIDHPALGLTMDLGHLGVTEEPPFEKALHRCASHILNVHIDDVKRGIHEHLLPGDGDLPMEVLMGTLQEQGFDGIASVELARDSHNAIKVAHEAFRRL